MTSEPALCAPKPGEDSTIFVVQKHAARRAGLHWDFRMEHAGVLWRWAVRDGPSRDPSDRRLAIHVEDHPLDYADFEGTIPAGQYGAGTVEIWDRGTWEPIGDPEVGVRKGNLRFVLAGSRLAGRFTLARLSRRDPRKQEGWFLIKGHDEHAREGMNALALEQEMGAPSPRKQAEDQPPAEQVIHGALSARKPPSSVPLPRSRPPVPAGFPK